MKIKIIFLFLLITFTIIFVRCSISSFNFEDDTYLTPIPESTLYAYQQKRPITTRFQAVLEATLQIHTTRMHFTQGEPKIISAEEITPKVWLVVFEGSWQILPPMSNDFSPLETGCIYVTMDENVNDSTRIQATSCKPKP